MKTDERATHQHRYRVVHVDTYIIRYCTRCDTSWRLITSQSVEALERVGISAPYWYEIKERNSHE